jgi:hypothetical protein
MFVFELYYLLHVRPDRLWNPRSLLYNRCQGFSRGCSGRSVAPGLRISRPVLLLPFCSSYGMLWCDLQLLVHTITIPHSVNCRIPSCHRLLMTWFWRVLVSDLWNSPTFMDSLWFILVSSGKCIFFSYGSTALYGPGPPRFVEVSWSHTFETHHNR